MAPTQPALSSLTTRLTSHVQGSATPPVPEYVDWVVLAPQFIAAWGRAGGKTEPEHLEILGPTGSGKSFFEATILKMRAAARDSHIVVVATKPADETVSDLGWPETDTWPPNQWRKENRQVIFWAKAPTPDDRGIEAQRTAVNELLCKLWRPQSNIVVAFDEIAYLEQDLQLKTIITRYYREGRALGITIVASTQRPQNVSRYMHSESKWKIAFAPEDEDDAERMAQVMGNKKFYTQVLMNLRREKREFLMIHTVTRKAYISHVTEIEIKPATRRAEEK